MNLGLLLKLKITAWVRPLGTLADEPTIIIKQLGNMNMVSQTPGKFWNLIVAVLVSRA
jgi:hypothetical protein